MPYPDNRPDIDYHNYFTGALTRLHAERRYRVFADLERIAGRAFRTRCGIRRRAR
jgi:hypothetical protein